MKIKPAPLFSDPPSWASVIGLFMLRFGSLEMLVFCYIEKCLPEEYDKWRDRHFKERVERVGSHFAQTSDQQQAFEGFLERLTPVRELRNHLAHGYLQMTYRPSSKEWVMGIVQTKDIAETSSSERKYLAFHELLEALNTLSQVTDEFTQLTGNKAGWSDSKSIDLSRPTNDIKEFLAQNLFGEE